MLSIFLATVLLTINIVIGYIVAPVLFSQLVSEKAGEIMGIFLSQLYWLNLIVSITLLMAIVFKKQCSVKREVLLLGFTGVTALNVWWVSPAMVRIKAMELTEVGGMSFGQWHGLSQVLFLLALITLSAWLFLRYRKIRTLHQDG